MEITPNNNTSNEGQQPIQISTEPPTDITAHSSKKLFWIIPVVLMLICVIFLFLNFRPSNNNNDVQNNPIVKTSTDKLPSNISSQDFADVMNHLPSDFPNIKKSSVISVGVDKDLVYNQTPYGNYSYYGDIGFIGSREEMDQLIIIYRDYFKKKGWIFLEESAHGSYFEITNSTDKPRDIIHFTYGSYERSGPNNDIYKIYIVIYSFR